MDKKSQEFDWELDGRGATEQKGLLISDPLMLFIRLAPQGRAYSQRFAGDSSCFDEVRTTWTIVQIDWVNDSFKFLNDKKTIMNYWRRRRAVSEVI